MSHEAHARLERIMKVRALLLDDLGKQKFTERAEMELYNLLEYRTSHKLTTLWTANGSGSDLLAKLSKDRGEPILRRLSEFSEVVSL